MAYSEGRSRSNLSRYSPRLESFVAPATLRDNNRKALEPTVVELKRRAGLENSMSEFTFNRKDGPD